jgi:hypothetical protein
MTRLSMPISVQSGTAVNAPYLTENHGVPGSNPGPATEESPAIEEKIRAPAVLPEPFDNGVSTAGSRNGLF